MKLYIGLIFLIVALPTLAQQPAAAGKPSSQPQTRQAVPAGQTQPITVPTTIAGMKTALEQSPNPILYTKQILKRRFKIDTIVVTRTRVFNSLADSLAYHGKEKRSMAPTARKVESSSYSCLPKPPTNSSTSARSS
ncbi:hypothetical protein ACQ86N_09690 [Puia sp. P3]|uniref:hypothetical protein n=1 Tax=Puia sp. P3 TaxID=3423952 RepID=UPI003D67CDD4